MKSKMASGGGPVSWAELSAAFATNPHRSQGLPFGGVGSVTTASGTIATIPDKMEVPWLPGSAGRWTEETTFAAADVLSFVLWVQDPMYRAAEPGVRRVQEQEVASSLLKSIDATWRAHHGRARGWVRKHLEEDLRGRAAGGDPPADFWTRLRTTRRVALLADYVLTVRGSHIGIWWPVGRTVTMIPLTGQPPVGVAQINAETGRPLLTPTGVPLLDPATAWRDLVMDAAAASGGIVWSPPACAPSAGAITVPQIQERLEALGYSKRSGSRAALWTLLHWEMLGKELAGEGVGALLSDDSIGSTGSTKVT